MKLKLALFCSLGLLAAANASACYTVYDNANRVLYQGFDAPVDMSRPLHEAMRGRYPAGAQLVFDQSNQCARTTVAQVSRSSVPHAAPGTIRIERTGRAQPVSTSAPLLTDRRTAQSLGLPHTVVAGEVVVVPAQAAARVSFSPLTVVPSTTVAAAPTAPNTAAMGAGPARPLAKPDTVITEMRDPPMTIVQQGSHLMVTNR